MMTANKSRPLNLQKYDLSNFDAEMNLKLGFNNLLLFFFLLCPIFITVVIYTMKGPAGAEILKTIYGYKRILYVSVLSTIPMVLYCVYLLFKNANEKPAVKFVQNHGFKFILVSTVLHLAVWGYSLAIAGNHAHFAQVLFVVVSALSLVYLFKSEHLKDYLNQHKSS